MKIPGWAYLLIGVLIAVYAKFIQLRSENSVMTLFFYIGILFVIAGVFKLIVSFITADKKTDNVLETKDFTDNSGGISNLKEGVINYGDSIMCPRCTARLHPKSNYCNWCGFRVRKK